MPVVCENIREPFAAHRLHRNAIGQAIALVEPRFVKSQARKKAFMGVRDNGHGRQSQRAAYIGGRLAPEMLTPFREKIQVFGDHLLGSDDLRRTERPGKG